MCYFKDFLVVIFFLLVVDYIWIKIEKLGILDYFYEIVELLEKFGYLKKMYGNFGLIEFIIY